MVRRAINAVTNKIGGLHQAAFWLASFSLASVFLGFLRDRLLAYHFGAGHELDVYYAAFEIPDLLFNLIASLASASILVPMLAKRETCGAEDHKSFVDSVFTSFFFVLALFCVAALVAMPWLVPLLFKGLGEKGIADTIVLSRILLLSPFFLGLSNFFGSIVQHEKRFVLYALSPLLYNAGIIVAVMSGAESLGIKVAVVGVAFGALLHVSLQAAWVFTTKHAPALSSKINLSYVKETFLLSIPRTVALSASSLVGSIFVILASRMSQGSIAIFTLAFNLQSVPLSLIGASYSLAAFPTLAEHYAKKQLNLLIECVSSGLRHIIFWSLPIISLFIVLRAHIVRVVLGSGKFDWADTRMTAAALAVFIISIVFQSLQLFLTRTHYALGRTRAPLLMNLSAAFFTVLFSLGIFQYASSDSYLIHSLASFLKVGDLSERSLVLILPLSFSLGALVAFILLWLSLDIELRKPLKTILLRTTRDSLLASLGAGFMCVASLRFFDSYFSLDSLLSVFLHGLLAGVVGLASGALLLISLKNKELFEIISKLKTRK